ncbi:hypothetical protein NEIELOOT_01949 [Neisseria elongata subsp. glycolytica ATCC 29315]|uniref:Uncharacterized protein n=1 Tax=Neisseria elongata subsp. glycolytica ATCC 29315 TaxID=546263 RepID=D4DSA5_NEIEG|nr:hypothetical protein NEIELOOT_01949 [Neisseria elongata subsp. glycolytica ATCC 29315]
MGGILQRSLADYFDPIPNLLPRQHTTKADRVGSVTASPVRR